MSYEGWMSAVWLFGQPLEVNMVIETSQFIDDVFWSKKRQSCFTYHVKPWRACTTGTLPVPG